ncbi:MAG TPA: helix-turn-helix domain-containing protein [Solirubrobacterales bacterium]|nr:helix-turn-helix domain-containing protein [Solirubrobacterales bacterium]
MFERKYSETPDPLTKGALGHPARRRIVLGLHAEGPMSPSGLSKSQLGKGIRVNVYSYHFKELERRGLIAVVEPEPRGRQPTTRYATTNRLTQAMVDAAALGAISDVVMAIPEQLAQWIEGPYIEEISALVAASGRSSSSGNI